MTILFTVVDFYLNPLYTVLLWILSTYFSTAYQPDIEGFFQKNTTYSVIMLARHKMLDKL